MFFPLREFLSAKRSGKLRASFGHRKKLLGGNVKICKCFLRLSEADVAYMVFEIKTSSWSIFAKLRLFSTLLYTFLNCVSLRYINCVSTYVYSGKYSMRLFSRERTSFSTGGGSIFYLSRYSFAECTHTRCSCAF